MPVEVTARVWPYVATSDKRDRGTSKPAAAGLAVGHADGGRVRRLARPAAPRPPFASPGRSPRPPSSGTGSAPPPPAAVAAVAWRTRRLPRGLPPRRSLGSRRPFVPRPPPSSPPAIGVSGACSSSPAGIQLTAGDEASFSDGHLRQDGLPSPARRDRVSRFSPSRWVRTNVVKAGGAGTASGLLGALRAPACRKRPGCAVA